MTFKESFLGYSVLSLWKNFSQMNPYYAVLAVPVFLASLFTIILFSLVIDTFLASKELIFNQ